MYTGILLFALMLFGNPDCDAQLAAQTRLLHDFGGLTHYGSDNTELRLSKPGEDRVVFFGDEITENWSRQFFQGKPYVNRGIAGQTTPQMLVRFRQDVIALKPKVVVILAGANDITGFSGPATESVIAENFMSMAELAQMNGIRVVLASVTPVSEAEASLRSPVRILGLNRWLKDYASRTGAIYVDYYSAMANGRNLKKELTVDGWLPNDAGYRVMAPLAEKAIAQAMAAK